MAGSGRTLRGAAAAALGCTALLGAGCGADRTGASAHESTSPAAPAAHESTSPTAAATHESTSPTAANRVLPSGAARRALAARYLAIAAAGNRRLDADFDPLQERDRDDLPRAKADLRDAAAAEHLFDHRLLGIVFPPETERVARDLYRVNEARARLTSTAAASISLRRLHAYEPRLDAANRPVEQAVRTIRRQLGLPPPPTG